MTTIADRLLLPMLALCLMLGAAPMARAQMADTCPQLPADAGLSWTQRSSDAFLVCRAVAEDGSEAFGMYLAADTPFQPRRSNREERGVINGQDIRWYRGEDASNPDALVRETLLELDRDRVVHIWMRTEDEEQLQRNMRLVEELHFDDMRISSN